MTEIQTEPEASPAPAPEAATQSRSTDAPPRSLVARFGAALLDFFSSYLLAIITLSCLMVLTYFGTYSQKEIGLVRAQQLYFDSLWTEIPLDALGVPDLKISHFPGGALLLIILTVNLILGGVVRIRWRWRTAGILITHFGILMLMAAGLVKFLQSTNGFLQLNPNEVGTTYTSFHEWELVIGEPRGSGEIREHLVDEASFREGGVIAAEGVPFKLRVDKYHRHCFPKEAVAANASDVVDKIMLRPEELPEQAPLRVPGIYVTAMVEGQPNKRGLVWGMENAPWTVTVDGVSWTVGLRKQVLDLPYAVRLEQFRREFHPGVMTPRHFSSDVTKIEDGLEQKFHIAMNEPMRYGGFTFSQNNWGPQEPGHPGPYYTVLEVSSNPSDQWPFYACIVIAIGMLWHFLRKLSIRLSNFQKSQAKKAATS